MKRKSMTVEWIKGHCRETEAIGAADKLDIMYNNITDGLAKQAAKLAPQDIVYTSPASISITGGEANARTQVDPEVTETTWSQRGALDDMEAADRHTAPTVGTVVVGNIAWTGCDYPGTVTKVTCPLCGLKHPGLVQIRLIQCPMWRDHFRREYCAAWGDWEPIAQRWWSQASEEDLNQAARLRIPTSFAYAVPLEQRHQWRCRAAEFQYVALITIQQLRGSLPMPTRDIVGPVTHQKRTRTQVVRVGTALRRRAVKRAVSDHKLWTHCRYKAADTEVLQEPGRRDDPKQFVARMRHMRWGKR